jgi:hypothetical protein
LISIKGELSPVYDGIFDKEHESDSRLRFMVFETIRQAEIWW